jgi:hypothetical protein
VSGPRRAGILEPRATSLISLPETCAPRSQRQSVTRMERAGKGSGDATAQAFVMTSTEQWVGDRRANGFSLPPVENRVRLSR